MYILLIIMSNVNNFRLTGLDANYWNSTPSPGGDGVRSVYNQPR